MNELASKVLKITIDYIGPASQRFLERQSASHLNGVVFSEITKEHIPHLIKWIEISASLLIDKSRAKELAEKIRDLA